MSIDDARGILPGASERSHALNMLQDRISLHKKTRKKLKPSLNIQQNKQEHTPTPSYPYSPISASVLQQI